MTDARPEPTKLDELADLWKRTKAHEDAAKAERLEIEKKMLEMMPEPESGEGSNSEDQNYYKITTTHGLQRNVRQDKVGELFGEDEQENSIIHGIFPTQHKLDLKKLRAAESANPDLYRRVCLALETKPRKASIKVAEIERDD
jgi:hypothetical protein